MPSSKNTCDFCTRPFTRENGWSVRTCEGHAIVAEANYDSHGPNGISKEEYLKRIEPARQWFKDNPRPKKDNSSEIR